MSTSRQPISALSIAAVVLALAILASVLTLSKEARADGIVFLTRLNNVIATYPANNAFNVGSTSPQGGAAKLGVALNVTDSFSKAFEIASTTGKGTATTTADLFKVSNTGCMQFVSTSSATQLKLVVTATTSQGAGTNFVLDAVYGTCP